MTRALPAFLGAGLTVLWVLGLSTDATVWLTWSLGIAAALSFATVGLIPERRSSSWAAFCLGALTLSLFVLAMEGYDRHATTWLSSWTLAGAGLAALCSVGAAVQGLLDALRARISI